MHHAFVYFILLCFDDKENLRNVEFCFLRSQASIQACNDFLSCVIEKTEKKSATYFV